MNEFLMIFRNEKADESKQPSAEQMQNTMKQWQDWITDLAAKGKFAGTNRLLPQGKIVKPGKVITDGPYVEAKEMVGGYLIVKAGSLDEAVELAKACPGLLYGGTVEVRNVMPIDFDPKSASFLQEKQFA